MEKSAKKTVCTSKAQKEATPSLDVKAVHPAVENSQDTDASQDLGQSPESASSQKILRLNRRVEFDPIRTSDEKSYASRSYQKVVRGIRDIYDPDNYSDHDKSQDSNETDGNESDDEFSWDDDQFLDDQNLSEDGAFGWDGVNSGNETNERYTFGEYGSASIPGDIAHERRSVQSFRSQKYPGARKRSIKRQMISTRGDRYRQVNFVQARKGARQINQPGNWSRLSKMSKQSKMSKSSPRSTKSTGDSDDGYVKCNPPNRILERNRAFHQSSGSLSIEQHADKESWTQILELYTFDWFHVVLTMPMRYLLLLVALVYTVVTLMFAAIYLLISDEHSEACNLNSEPGREITFMATFAFAVHTTSTIGYGTIDDTPAYFQNCPRVPTVVFFQCLMTMFLNGLLITLFFQRVGRADRR